MPKQKNKPGYVVISWDILNSEAYKAILPMSAKLLPYFLGKPKKGTLDPAYYTSTFSFTYGEASRFGCSRRNFPRVIADLMLCGFIDPVEKGGLRGYGLASSIFKLSARWRRFRKPDFVEIRWESFSKEGVHRQAPNCPPISANMAYEGGMQ
jgi:hypothetical protein